MATAAERDREEANAAKLSEEWSPTDDGDEGSTSSSTEDEAAALPVTFEAIKLKFALPINDAAKSLGMCPTVLKKVCRKMGIPRWPSRKIRCLDRMIAQVKARIAEEGASEASGSQLELESLKQKREFLVNHPGLMGGLDVYSSRDWTRLLKAPPSATATTSDIGMDPPPRNKAKKGGAVSPDFDLIVTTSPPPPIVITVDAKPIDHGLLALATAAAEERVQLAPLFIPKGLTE